MQIRKNDSTKRTIKLACRWLLILLSLGALLTYGLFSVSGLIGLIVAVLALPVSFVRRLWTKILPPDAPRFAKAAILSAAFLLLLAASPDTPAVRTIPQEKTQPIPTPVLTVVPEMPAEQQAAPASESPVASDAAAAETLPQDGTVYVSGSGAGGKYHSDPSCSNMKNPVTMTRQQAESEGYTPCKRCCS